MPAPCQKEASLPTRVVTQKYFWPQPHNRSEWFEKERARKSLAARESLERVCATLGHLWQQQQAPAAAAAPTSMPAPTPLHPSARTTTIHTVPPPMPGPRQLARKKPDYLAVWRRGLEGSTCADRHWISLHRAAFSFGISCSDQGLHQI